MALYHLHICLVTPRNRLETLTRNKEKLLEEEALDLGKRGRARRGIQDPGHMGLQASGQLEFVHPCNDSLLSDLVSKHMTLPRQ